MNTGLWLPRAIAMLLVVSLGACASVPEDQGFAAQDPYENTNRKFHAFNVGLDRYVLRPAAQGYDVVAVGPLKSMIGNGFNHLALPGDFANHLMQGEFRAAGRTLGRVILNTGLGMGGLLDPATEFGLPRESNDFGVTLGKWGVSSGAYLVVPLLGPSSPRDLGGFAVDQAFSPTTYFGFVDAIPGGTGVAMTATERVDLRNQNADLIDEILYESPDSYVTLRSIYLQRRQALVAGEDAEALPDIFDDDPAQ
ncbi:MAG: VacJ family lipoprotein [Pseudomonadota bacterium]